jgi:hypothetical protein
MRGVWWQEKQIHSPLLPVRNSFFTMAELIAEENGWLDGLRAFICMVKYSVLSR